MTGIESNRAGSNENWKELNQIEVDQVRAL